MKRILFFWILAVICCSGCKKSGSAPAKPAPISWTAGSSVYIVGSDSGRITYWQNGVKTALGMGDGNGIAVSGSDVYVGGTVFLPTGTTEKAAYWKNGKETDLTDTGTAWAFQPALRGGDVYVPGYIFGPYQQVYPVYWKNGERFNLDASTRGVATGIAIADTDIYIVGQVYDGPFDTALVWKNGEPWNGLEAIEAGTFNQIYASGNDIYVTFQSGYSLNQQAFTHLPGAGAAVSVFVSGTDVYVAGTDSTAHAAYWKNGVLVSLPNYKNATDAFALGIAVAGPDVYVIGQTILNGFTKGVVWKNGVEDSLTGNGELTGVVVGN